MKSKACHAVADSSSIALRYRVKLSAEKIPCRRTVQRPDSEVQQQDAGHRPGCISSGFQKSDTS